MYIVFNPFTDNQIIHVVMHVLLEVTFTQFAVFWSGTCCILNSSVVVREFLAFFSDNLKRVCTGLTRCLLNLFVTWSLYQG